MKTTATKCRNGNAVESWYDRSCRSWVVRTVDADGNQLGDAAYVGTRAGMDRARESAITQGNTFKGEFK